METNLQTNCYNCSKPLPQTGYFCGGCLTQVKCKSCGSSLEKDDAGCVNCGTPKEVRAEIKTGSHQNINTFRLHETATDRTIEATFSDDVAKDLAGTLRDAAAAGRMRAIASSFPPSNDFNGADKETADFAEAEVVNNGNTLPKTEAIHKPVQTDTAKQEEYPTLKAVAMKNLPGTETEWIVVYAFYASNYGKDTFTRQNLIEKYEESNRLDNNKKSALSMYIKRAVQGNFINPLADDYSILDNGIEKAKEIISRTSSSSVKLNKQKSKKVESEQVSESKGSSTVKKKTSVAAFSPKRLTEINFYPSGKKRLVDFKSYYAYYHCYNGCKFRIIIKKHYKSGQKEYAIKQHQVTQSLDHLFDRSIKAKELLLRGEIDEEDFYVIKSDCERRINSMGNDLQQVALDIIGLQKDIDKEVSQLLCMDQLFLKLPFDRKVKMIRLILNDKIVPGDKTFQSALNDITNTMIGTKVFGHENISENPKTQVCSEYDAESKYFYNELTNDADFNAIKASSMFWQKFPQIVTYLKDMASLISFQSTDGHQIA